MDKNIEFKNLINDITKYGQNNTFFKDLIGLNGTNELIKNEDIEAIDENKMQCLNATDISDNTQHKEVNDSNQSLQLLSDHEMQTKLTPSLDLKANVSQRRQLFTFHNKRQLFQNNFCVDNQKPELNEEIVAKDNEWENTLGLSPVKKQFISEENKTSDSINNCMLSVSEDKYSDENNPNNAFESLNGIQFTSFSSNDNQMDGESHLGDNHFRSLSKCSDIELRPEEIKIDLNQTFRSPNSEFESKSISTYFNHRSEPIHSFKSTDNSIAFKTITNSENDFSLLNESFASVFSEIDLSNNTLETAQKIIERQNRKRKTDLTISLSCAEDIQSEKSFTPSINSTLNSSEDNSDKDSPDSGRGKSVVTSGLRTISTVGQTYSMANTNSTQSIAISNGSALNLNQLLVVSPNVLSLTIGCFVDFKLNYLKVKNLSITSFKAEIKLKTNVDTLNSLQIECPKKSINIPAFFEGLLTDEISITPLKSGAFSLTFQIYISIEGINIPINPMSVVCHIKAEELVIKRPLYLSNCLEFNYNLFEDNTETQTIELCISNRQIVNEIPLKICLEPNKRLVFEPIHRHPDSAIHTFRCSDPNTLFLVTKTQYEMRIPIRIQSYGVQQTESSLTVSTDSLKSQILAIFHLKAIFWPKTQLIEPSLQCSQTTITLKSNKWKEIHFRNKSKEGLIRVILKCMKNKRTENSIKLSVNQLMIPPLKKASICLFADQMTELRSNSNIHLLVTYDSGSDKSFKLSIPLSIE